MWKATFITYTVNCNRLCSAPPSPQPSDVLHASPAKLETKQLLCLLDLPLFSWWPQDEGDQHRYWRHPWGPSSFLLFASSTVLCKGVRYQWQSSLRDFCLLDILTGEKRIHRKEPHNLTPFRAAAATASGFLRQFTLPKQMLERDEKHLFLIKMPLLSHIIILIIRSPQLKPWWTSMFRQRLPLRQINLLFLSTSDQLAHTVTCQDGRKHRISADSDYQNT